MAEPKRPAGPEWRYTPGGSVVHAMYPPIGTLAICGTEVWNSAEWRGTGSQVEYDRAASMRMCRRCGDRLGVVFDD